MATTIKLPEELRDRVNQLAAQRRLSAAGAIELLLDEHDRVQRMQAFGHAFRSADSSYWEEFTDFDSLTPKDAQ